MEPTPGLVVDEGTGGREVSLPELLAHEELVEDVGDRLPDRRGAAVPVSAVFETNLPYATVASSDGAYTASIPTADLRSGGLLLVGDPEHPLQPDEGGPIRLVVTEGSTLCWNVKAVGSITATPARQPDSVPENPPH